MSLSIGIVGLPNVGKSTLFQAITQKQVSRENYPFCTIDPNIGTVVVPDERIEKIAELENSAKKVYTTIEFVDIAGLVEGASKGEGLGNKFLANIRETDAIVYVLRAFSNKKVINTQDKIDILKDKDILDMEMALKDLATLEKRIVGLEKEARSRNKDAVKELSILKKAIEILEQGKVLENQDWQKDEQKILKAYQLLTLKPRLFLLNGRQGEVAEDILKIFEKNNWPFLIMDLLDQFDSAELTKEERKELGLATELELNVLIKESYKLLDLITFFTTGADETRAWTLRKGSTAPQAGGAVHSDFEKCFVKANVVRCQDLLVVGGLAKAKEKGLIRTEGKDYVVVDGDVIEIKAGV
jgi:GTP-binding protein YchF